ncbi:MAG: hypothetical protein A3F83_02980 [Candidatus Glassbacteria bacterium RIFCSPLOWO2_12_FULL_58_11]|uniref:Uncharacterized protein n=1 Tax=Candidatus Glassbacteria bacterium RIFCSPLOWO2_12_FULL_58_11 TaxID=1817867 RepID=A0A1F5YZ05_9BACT|nr:MAG: hypothetical protein A3F83_02980 [Candidatus Glassbacteria bacterium RIFCSPLOWO2_12_FULL_58_11]
MKISRTVLLLLLTLSLPFAACNRDGGPSGLSPDVYRELKKAAGVHPRLILTGEVEEKLFPDLSTSRQWLWKRYLEDLPEKTARAGKVTEVLDRGNGNLAADLAFAWRATGSDSLFQLTKRYVFDLCAIEVWDPEYDLLHGHLLLGVALAYDWLYPSLNRAERSQIALKLGDEAQMQYQQIARNRAWYRNQYLQNHAHVNYCGLAYAAVALYGEDARAQEWLAVCEEFFTQVFALSLKDGGSIEGLSYGNYALEFCLFYAELARTCLARDYYGSPWLKNYPQYILYSLLPALRGDEWAMAFGDSPNHGNSHGPEPQCFRLAAQYADQSAQWLGTRLIELQPHGLNSASWWALLWYDPQVREADPDTFPTLKEFSEIGQVMLRSAWRDSSAALIGIKCGPYLGQTRSKDALYDLGGAHGHPDAGSFQIFARGRFLAVDPGYTYFKRTANHSTLIVKGQGQLGGEEPWFAAAEALEFHQRPAILETRSTPQADYVLADLAPAYHPALRLEKALRHFLYLKPDLLLIADQLALDNRGVVFTYPADTLQLEGGLRLEGGYVTGTRGQASFAFSGPDGWYRIAASYIDNAPLTGAYSILVNGDTIHSWQDTVEITDTHLEISPKAKLTQGSRVSFSAAPMGQGARLVKMALYGPDIDTERELSWQLHLPPGTPLERKFTRIEAAEGDNILDIYPLAPQQRNHAWAPFTVKAGAQIKETLRLEIRPVFTTNDCTMLTLLHFREKSGRPLDWLRSEINNNLVTLHWYRDQKSFALELDLESRKFSLRE